MKFTTSVNIERDINKDFDYIVTPNSRMVFNEIVNNYKSGIHSFNIIGSYGTGKSSFLLAFEKNLRKDKIYFAQPNGQFGGLSDFEFINIVGKYNSLETILIEKFGLDRKKDTITSIKAYFERITKTQKFIILLIDEFGKILEFAAKNNPEKDLYFIQLFTEVVNNPELNVIFMSTLHQNFNSYSHHLTISQKNEWVKVKGRFKEIAFNEPVEQLIYLAAERLKEKQYQIIDTQKFDELYTTISDAKLIDLSSGINKNVAEFIYPLDLLAASVLTLSLQKYGQNERSLFTFFDAQENHSLAAFDTVKSFVYSVENVFNYLSFNYYNFLYTKYNPDYKHWIRINEVLDKVESDFNEGVGDAAKVIKTIGLINIFADQKGKLNKDFITKYSEIALQIYNATEVIEKLERFRIIKFAKHKGQYVFVEGTDVDIELELLEAGANIQKTEDVTEKIRELISMPYISAKAVQYEFGTPRFFEYKITHKPINETPVGEVDGFINLVFNQKIADDDFIKQSANCEEAILYVQYKNTNEIIEILHEIDKINYVTERIDKADKVALRELIERKDYELQRLNRTVVDNLYTDSELINWYYVGKQIEIGSKTQLNKYLSHICKEVYSLTPVYKNEMVNKHRYSSAITLARKSLFANLFENWMYKNLKFEDTKYPPEKSIYLTLLQNTGIHRKEEPDYILGEPTDKSFLPLWNASVAFLEGAKSRKKNLSALIKVLSARPFKLKQGFIDFWIPVFLFVKSEDYALFGKNGFIPEININIIDFLSRNSDEFSIKTFDISGVKLDVFNKYRQLINLDEKQKAEKTSFIETIRPFMTFYVKLPDYTKNTKRLSQNALRLRDAIAKAKDPEQTFFEDFPNALGFKNLNLKQNEDFLKDFVHHLQSAIKDLRTCYSELINRIETVVLQANGISESDFAAYRKQITMRFKNIKLNLLLPKQKSFYNRINSAIDDRSIWLGSLAHDLLGRSLELMKDEEEEFLFEKIRHSFAELDNLVAIHKTIQKNQKDEIIKFDLTTTKQGMISNQIIVPESKQKDLNDLQKKIKQLLSSDDTINKAALIKILQQKLK